MKTTVANPEEEDKELEFNPSIISADIFVLPSHLVGKERVMTQQSLSFPVNKSSMGGEKKAPYCIINSFRDLKKSKIK